MPRNCVLIGAPVDSGKRLQGCLMGPDALRVAGLADALTALGHAVTDLGNLAPLPVATACHMPAHIHAPNKTKCWAQAIAKAAQSIGADELPIFLGGDHSLSLGSVPAMTDRAAAAGKPQFVLWLDAHADFHTPDSSTSGHLHGTPLAYATGKAGFSGFPPVPNPVPEDQVCILGLRSVDLSESELLQASAIRRHDMRQIDETGIARPLAAFLDNVAQANGALHVSLDVDFLDPAIAPAVGTTVPGGATIREAHLVMEMICDSGLMTSLDLVELNPFLDERGRTAQVMVDLAASALGRRVFDRPTQAIGYKV